MKGSSIFAIILFLAIAIGHLLRLIFGWPVTLNENAVPMWLSGVAVVLALTAVILLWRDARRPS